MAHVHELKSGQVFQIPFPKDQPPGRLKVISSLGVQFPDLPPSDPWSVLCKDEAGEIHLLVVPATTDVRICHSTPSIATKGMLRLDEA